MKPRIVFLDMDDVIADFTGHSVFEGKKIDQYDACEMYAPGFFEELQPVEGALIGVRKLIHMGYDVRILTQPLANSPDCYSEKARWVARWFPELVGKINMVQDKGLMQGDYLIDDNKLKWEGKFKGKFVHFTYVPPWDAILITNSQVWKHIVEVFENHNLTHKQEDKEEERRKKMEEDYA